MSALEWLLLKPKVCLYPDAAALLVQMAVSPQLCTGAGQPGRTIGALCELCQVVRGVCTGTHTCAVQMVYVLLPFRGLQRRSAQSFCLHLNLGIPAATFRREVSRRGSLQEAEPTPCTGSLSSLRELFVSGTGKCVLCQESAGPWLRLDWCIKRRSPSHPIQILAEHWPLFLHNVFPTQHLKEDPGLSFTKHLRPNSALS